MEGDFLSGREPKYYNSWKGRVLEAIIINNAHTWKMIQLYTDLNDYALKRALAELFSVNAIEKRNNEYYVIDNILRKEYKDHLKEEASLLDLLVINDLVKSLVDGIKSMIAPSTPKSKFLDSANLSAYSKEIISKARQEVLVMNPFIKQCPLSETLKLARRNKAQVTTIMRRPFDVQEKNYHQTLKEVGIRIVYDNKVHAKLIVVDQKIAIVSSMNFFHKSSEGGSYEAGHYTNDFREVEKIRNAILRRI